MAITLAQVGKCISKGAKAFAGKPLSITSKALGVATAASIIYDSHVNGRETAFTMDEITSGERYMNMHRKYMTSNSNSATVSQLKKGWFMGMQASSCCHFWTKVKGYIKGAGETLFNNIPRIALSAVALASIKNKNKAVSTAGKIAGSLLGLGWIRTYVTDVLGFGAKSPDRYY